MSNITSVPVFILYFEGSRIPVEREAEIKKIIVTDHLNAPSGFQIIAADPTGEWCHNKDYAVGSEIKILLGYKDNVKPLIVGEVLGLSLHMRKNQSAQVTIKGANALHRLNRNRMQSVFMNMTDKDIIGQLAGDGGIGIGEIENLNGQHKFTLRQNMTAYEYLNTLAERFDCYFYIRDKKLTFKRLGRNVSEELTLEYGKTLKELSITTDTSRSISEVEVRAWDYARGTAVVGTAAHTEIDSAAGAIVNDNWGANRKITIDHFTIDQNSAYTLATDILTRNSRNYLNGKGCCEGNPEILAGTVIKIEGLGSKFSGKYLLTSVTHQLDMSGAYQTRFSFTGNIASGNASTELPGLTMPGLSVSMPQLPGLSIPNLPEAPSLPALPSLPKLPEFKPPDLLTADIPSLPDINLENLLPSIDITVQNLRWTKEDKEAAKIQVDDLVLLKADVTGKTPVAVLEFKIFIRDNTGREKEIHKQKMPVIGGTALLPWLVTYKEKAEEHTDPQYYFTCTATPFGVEGKEKPAVKIRDWAELFFKEEETGVPYPDCEYTLKLPDGSERRGKANKLGYAFEEDLPPGKYTVVVQQTEYDLELKSKTRRLIDAVL